MASTSKNQKGSCDYCHQKPKFGKHNYCGKTCSQQAAAANQNNPVANPQPQLVSPLCKQCGQNAKFQNFDFCGKNCAATWQLANGGSNGKPNPPPKNSLGGNVGVAANLQLPNQLLGNISQPLQAQLQAVLPAVVAALQQQNQNQQQQQPPPGVQSNATNVAPVPPPKVPQQSTVAATLPNNTNRSPPQQTNVGQNVGPGPGPSFPALQNTNGPVNGASNATIPTSAPGLVQAAIPPTTCRLTGCGQPVFTDLASNHASEYCSKRHREEAVSTGQVQPCIMCLKMPRTTTDHFCSKACRDTALSQ